MDDIIIFTLFICLLLWIIQFCKQNNNLNIQLCKLINSYSIDKKNKEISGGKEESHWSGLPSNRLF